MLKKEYTKDDVTIVWQPDLCTHSGVCFRKLPAVFKPRERPWIQLDQADAASTISAVQACPSGALSMKAKQPELSLPSISETDWHSVSVVTNGPLRIKAACRITLPNGEVVEKPAGVSLCRCGESGNKPFCDGSHKSNGFSG